MLNEIWSVAKALEKRGVSVRATSKLFRKNKRATGLRVYLSDSGEISRVEVLDKDFVSNLGRYELANGMSFPSFNLKKFREFSKDFSQELDSRIKSAQKSERPGKAILSVFQSLFSEPRQDEGFDNYCRLVGKRLNDLPQSVAIVWGGGDIGDDFLAIRRLILALSARKWGGKEFLVELERKILEYADSLGQEELIELYKLCFKSESPLLLDVEVEVGAIAVASVEMSDYLNQRLLDQPDEEQTIMEGEIFDSLSGHRGQLEKRFPSPILPILGKVILFSNPKDVECQSRYGLQEGRSFATSTETGQKLQDALSSITEASRREKTWCPIPADYGKGSNLVIAYPEQAPEFEIGVAQLLSSDQQREGVFESQAESVLSALIRFKEKYGDSTIRFFIMGKADPGRCQVYLTELLTYDIIRGSAKRWATACKNVPAIPLILPPSEKGKPSETIRFSLPSPVAALKVLNLVFLRDGNSSTRTNTASLRDVYDLFLQNSDRARSSVRRLLTSSVLQLGPLLVHAGALRTSNRWESLTPENRLLASSASAVLGMLLFFKGRKKEQYMSDIAYNLGKLLQCADFIHREYCYEVRNGGKTKDLPGSLVGQSMFNAAMTRPSLALEQLAVRMRVYLQWANTVSTGQRVGLVKWGYKQFQEISRAIPRTELQRKFTERDRAELFLGYLSDLNETPQLTGEAQ